MKLLSSVLSPVSGCRSLFGFSLRGLSVIFKMPDVRSTLFLLLFGVALLFIKEQIRTIKAFDYKLPKIQSESYSFDQTNFGFKNNTNFFSDMSELALEKSLLETLPLRLRSRASENIRAVLKICEKHQVDPIWITSVIWTESHFKSSAKSSVGARGLMQVMPSTKKYLYKKLKRAAKNLIVEKAGFQLSSFYAHTIDAERRSHHLDKLVNIELGVIYLKQLLKRFGNDHKLATIAYNMGPSWTRSQLANNRPVGVRNNYLNKVQYAYNFISKRI